MRKDAAVGAYTRVGAFTHPRVRIERSVGAFSRAVRCVYTAGALIPYTHPLTYTLVSAFICNPDRVNAGIDEP